MEQLIICLAILLLAVYGLLVLLKELISPRRKMDEEGLKLAVIVKNREQDIEWIVRKLMAGEDVLTTRCKRPIIILDMDSNDDTYGILEKLDMEYDELEVLPFTEKDRLFSELL